MKKSPLNLIKNQTGSLSIDFLFAVVLVMGVSGVLFALMLSLTVVEISQYIAFASSRNYYAAHFNSEYQETLAEEKYNQLVFDSPWQVLFKRDGWFSLDYIGSGDFREEYPGNIDHDNDKFWGTKLLFESNVLGFRIPIFGSTNPEEAHFRANITSFLGREPSSAECVDFVNQRWSEILSLNSKYSNPFTNNTRVEIMYDNGC